MEQTFGVILRIILVVFFVVFWAAVTAIPVWWLWNQIMPELFGLKVITLWQALLLALLVQVLFNVGNHTGSVTSKTSS